MSATPFKITLTSSTISTPQNLDWMSGQPTAFGVVGSSSGTFAYTVEGSFDDLTLTASASVVWFSLSSASANSSAIVFLGPLGGIRLNVSAASSASISLHGMQGIGT
jgi:hypothetical protein